MKVFPPLQTDTWDTCSKPDPTVNLVMLLALSSNEES